MGEEHKAVHMSEDEVAVSYGDLEICRLRSRVSRTQSGAEVRVWLLDPRFPMEAERIYRAGAEAGGLPEEQRDLTCFLARLYHLLSRPTRLLHPGAFSQKAGRGGRPPDISQYVTGDRTPLPSLLEVGAPGPGDTEIGTPEGQPFWASEYVGLIKEADVWLRDGPGPGVHLDQREIELAS